MTVRHAAGRRARYHGGPARLIASAAADRFQALRMRRSAVSRAPRWRPPPAPGSTRRTDGRGEAVLAVRRPSTDGAVPQPARHPGVTPFIETQRALLSELLDLVLPDTAVDHTAVGARAFNERYGLRSERPLVRFRLLDPALYLQGLSDLSLPPEQFASLRLPPRRVFITENRTNGLAFPDCPGSMVVFGLGYGLERLAAVGWLRSVEVHYWGDIDRTARS